MADFPPQWVYTYLPFGLVGFLVGSIVVLLLAGYDIKDVRLNFISWSHPDKPVDSIPGRGRGKFRWIPLFALVLAAGLGLGVGIEHFQSSTINEADLSAANATIAERDAEIADLKQKLADAEAAKTDTSALKAQIKKLTAERDQLKDNVEKLQKVVVDAGMDAVTDAARQLAALSPDPDPCDKTNPNSVVKTFSTTETWRTKGFELIVRVGGIDRDLQLAQLSSNYGEVSRSFRPGVGVTVVADADRHYLFKVVRLSTLAAPYSVTAELSCDPADRLR